MTSPGARSATAAADGRIPAQHPFAAHLRRAAVAERAAAHRLWTPEDGPLPSLYISHGAPMLFEMTGWMTELHSWARALPKPKAVLIVSAHWESAPLSISSSEPRELVYDFGGFDPMYYQMRYDTPAATELAQQVAKLMPDTEPVHEHRSRGLDHGAWVPLKIMYPDADIPVLQLSMPTHNPERLLDLGRRLRPLREAGVLVIGSGYMTHGLPFIDWSNLDQVPGWSSDFDAWAADGSVAAPSATNSGVKCSTVGCAYGMPGARVRKAASSSTSPRASASDAQESKSEDQPGTWSRLLQSMNGRPCVM